MTTDFNTIPAWQSSDLSNFSCSPSLKSDFAGRSHSFEFAYVQLSPPIWSSQRSQWTFLPKCIHDIRTFNWNFWVNCFWHWVHLYLTPSCMDALWFFKCDSEPIIIITLVHSAFGPYVCCTCTKTFKTNFDLEAMKKSTHNCSLEIGIIAIECGNCN